MTYLILEWTGTDLVASRFFTRAGELVFQERESRPAASEADLAAALRELAPSDDDCRPVLAIPLGRLFSREIDLPIQERAKLRLLLPLELKGETALENEDLVFDGLPLAAEGKVLALWARKREIAHLVQACTEAGIDPEVVTTAPIHWEELLSPDEAEAALAVTDGTALAVYGNGKPLFFRALGSDEGELSRTLAALEMAKQVRIERLFWHGSPVGNAPAEAEGVPMLALPVTDSLAAAFGGDEAAARENAGAWALARALQTGRIGTFRAGELAWTRGREQLKRRLRIPAILTVLLLLLLAADAGIRYTMVKRDLTSVNASIAALYREVFPGRKKSVDELGELKAEIRRLGAAGAGSHILDTLRGLAKAKGDDVTGLFEVEIDGTAVRLKGDARSTQAVSQYRDRLASVLADAEVGQITAKPDGSVTFSLKGTISEVAK